MILLFMSVKRGHDIKSMATAFEATDVRKRFLVIMKDMALEIVLWRELFQTLRTLVEEFVVVKDANVSL